MDSMFVQRRADGIVLLCTVSLYQSQLIVNSFLAGFGFENFVFCKKVRKIVGSTYIMVGSPFCCTFFTIATALTSG